MEASHFENFVNSNFDFKNFVGRINIYEYALYRLEYEYAFINSQLSWLQDIENREFMMPVYIYSEAENYSTQAENFSLAAVDAAMAGGEVDF